MVVWQRDALNTTLREAAEEFARTHWDKPRRIGRWVTGPTVTFKLADGVAMYEIGFSPDRRLIQVKRLDP